MEKNQKKEFNVLKLLHSFHTQVALILIISALFVGALCHYLIYQFALQQQFTQIQEKLKIIAQTAAFAIDADQLMQIPLTREGLQSPYYKAIYNKLDKIRKANPLIKYIYTMARTDKPGLWVFVVDPDTGKKEYESQGSTSYPGDMYDASRFPEMLKAFEGPSVDKKIATDEWGSVLSGYAPIRDKTGRAVAMIGVDILADDIHALQAVVQRRGLLVGVVGAVFAVTLGLIFSRRLTYRIENIIEGTRRLKEGDLLYHVRVQGRDEIGELGRSFNEMAGALYASRKKMHNYFFHAVQSLIRVLETKDPFMLGHSDRVAIYAHKIMEKMGYPPDAAAIVKEAAQLHDIGKLGIPKTILDKPGPLAPEEWKIVEEHPIQGEEILRPVVFDEEILAMVRSHHEHYDGKGYPDRIGGEEINLFSQVISIADAFDAMTSDRPYRKAFTRAKAIEEIKKNRGAQFNPKIVDAAIQVFEADQPS